VVELLVAMGYGGSYADAARVVGKSGDGGIDGIIKEDRLGLESIYVQAKRWEATVGRPTIQQCMGALHGNRAHKDNAVRTVHLPPAKSFNGWDISEYRDWWDLLERALRDSACHLDY
jgi:restriction endonuclease Mrr